MSQHEKEIETKDFVSIFGLFLGLLQFLKKYQRTLLFSVLISSAIGIGYYFLLYPKEYKSSMIIYSQCFQIEDISVVVNQLNDFIESDNYEKLASALQITPKEAEMLKKFSVTLLEFDKTEKEKKSDEREEKFNIQLKVYDKEIFNKITNGVSKFILRNEYLMLQSQEMTAHDIQLRNRISRELLSLDSLKNTKVVGNNMRNMNSSMMFYNPAAVYESIIKLYGTQVDIEYKLSIGYQFRIIKGFESSVKLSSLGLVKFLILVVFGSFFLTSIYLAMRDVINKI